MAEHLDKDAKSYAEEYVSFRRDLKTFHDSRGSVFAQFFILHLIGDCLQRLLTLLLLLVSLPARPGSLPSNFEKRNGNVVHSSRCQHHFVMMYLSSINVRCGSDSSGTNQSGCCDRQSIRAICIFFLDNCHNFTLFLVNNHFKYQFNW